MRQSCRHTNLKVCLARDPVGDLHCLARPSFGETERAAIEDLAELMREARMRRIRMGVALAVVVIPFLLLMTAVLPRMLSFTSTGISTEMSRPSIDEFDEACMKTINVRVAGVVLHFYPYTLFFYGLLEFIAVTTVTAASNQSFGHFKPPFLKRVSHTSCVFPLSSALLCPVGLLLPSLRGRRTQHVCRLLCL